MSVLLDSLVDLWKSFLQVYYKIVYAVMYVIESVSQYTASQSFVRAFVSLGKFNFGSQFLKLSLNFEFKSSI